jgi:nicotinamidase-related amidase
MTQPGCLITVDWQKAFRDTRYWGKRNNPRAEEKAAMLTTGWRRRGWPLIHVRHASLMPGSPLAASAPGFAFEDFAVPRADEREYVKHVNSAFIGTALEEDLRAAGLNRLVICGVTTDHCVSTTVRMAANLGFSVTLAHDACFTFARRALDGRMLDAQMIHDANLASLNEEFAEVMSVEDILRTECA